MIEEETNTAKPNPAAAVRDSEVTLDPRIQDAIGRSIKAHYNDLINAPIPDKFLVLLAELEAKEQGDGR